MTEKTELEREGRDPSHESLWGSNTNNNKETNSDAREKDEELTSAEQEKTYPPKNKLIPTMIAIYLVFFLVALVS